MKPRLYVRRVGNGYEWSGADGVKWPEGSLQREIRERAADARYERELDRMLERGEFLRKVSSERTPDGTLHETFSNGMQVWSEGPPATPEQLTVMDGIRWNERPAIL